MVNAWCLLAIAESLLTCPLSTDAHRSAEAHSDRGMISVRNPKADDREPPKTFSFDAVFGPDSLQKTVYDVCASSLVESVLNGYNGTIFAYGQVCVFTQSTSIFSPS